MNIFKLLLNASIVVQAILLILLFFSVFSWTIIIFKRRALRAAAAQSKKFTEVFKKSRNLTEVQEASKTYPGSPLSAIFQAGFKEMAYLAKQHTAAPAAANGTRLENLGRALTKASNAEVAKMEKMMGFLATTGSVTPFIGLFGTVWGDHGFVHPHRLDQVGQPGHRRPRHRRGPHRHGRRAVRRDSRSHRLQRLLHSIKDRITDMEDFSLELLSIAERLYGTP